jgi:hypothetical protein
VGRCRSFSNHGVENCGNDEKVNIGIFPFFVQEVRKLGQGQPIYSTCLLDYIYNFSNVLKGS